MHVTRTKAVKVSLLSGAVPGEPFGEASRFRDELYACLTGRNDELFELAGLLAVRGRFTARSDPRSVHATDVNS